MSILARSDPAPNDATTTATLSIDTYDSEQRAGSMPSLTLYPGGKDKSVIRRHLPVVCPLGTTPILLR